MLEYTFSISPSLVSQAQRMEIIHCLQPDLNVNINDRSLTT